MEPNRVFLLSPADTRGKRAGHLLQPASDFELAVRLRTGGGAPLGEVFSFVSGLYFRGKLTYARRFSRHSESGPGPLVITAGRGLMPADALVTPADLEEFSRVRVDRAEPLYLDPLSAAAEALAEDLAPEAELVLLGSIASAKYFDVLLEIFGDRLRIPEAFVGMGDMQRGSMLLRAAAAGIELPYIGARGAIRSTARTRTRRSR